MKDLDEKDVQIKRALCPKCGKPVLVGVLHMLDSTDLRSYEKHEKKYGCKMDIIPLAEHQNNNAGMCFLDCDKKDK
jgi:hypothetical protein